MLTADPVRVWQSKHENGGRLTGCLCSPIAQNHELTELASEDFNIVDDYIGHELSYDALK
jgi:hypothetical protein